MNVESEVFVLYTQHKLYRISVLYMISNLLAKSFSILCRQTYKKEMTIMRLQMRNLMSPHHIMQQSVPFVSFLFLFPFLLFS